jgi:tetratricopeptide (TPR) repeat protein
MNEILARAKTLPSAMGEMAHERTFYQAKALHALGILRFGLGDFIASLDAFEESASLFRQIGEKRMLAQSLAYVGIGRAFLADREAAYEATEESLTLAREVGDKVILGGALNNMAAVLTMTQGDLKMAYAYHEEGIQLLREAESHWLMAMTEFGFGLFTSAQGNHAQAAAQFEACLPLFTELRDKHRIVMVHSELAHLQRRQGHFVEAKPLYRETIQEWQRLGHRAAIAHQLECFAFIAKAQEEVERAAHLFGAAEILRETINIPMTPAERLEYDREVNDLRANMDEAAFMKAWAEGRMLTMEQAIAATLE